MAKSLKVSIIGDASSYARALSRASGHTSSFGRSLTTLGKAAVIGGAAMGGLAVVMGVKFAKAAIEEEAQIAKLNQAFKNQGIAMEDASKQVQALEQVGRDLGFTDDEVRVSLTKLIQAGNDYGEASKEMAVAQDLARASGKDLATTTSDLIRLQGGALRAAKQYGIVLPDLTAKQWKAKAAADGITIAQEKGQFAYEKLTQKVAGQGEAFAKTAAGGMARFHAAAAELQDQVGGLLAPAIGAAAGKLADFVTKINEAHGASAKLGVVWDTVKNAASGIFEALKTAIQNIDWGKVWLSIRISAGSLIDRIDTALRTANWEQIGKQVGLAIQRSIKFAAELAVKFTEEMYKAAKQVDWDKVSKGFSEGLFGSRLGGTVQRVLAKGLETGWENPIRATSKAARNIADVFANGFSSDTKANEGKLSAAMASAIDKAASNAKLVATLGAHAVGAKLAQGVAQGIRDNLLLAAQAAVLMVTTAIGAANTAADAKSPSRKMMKLGRDMVEGLAIPLRTLGPTLARLLTQSITAGLDKTKAAAVKGMGNAAGAIVAAAKKAGVDARAALAVAMTEGGTKFGAVGDKGTSFGPFQLHIGGASPFSDPAKAAAFANSIKGITYALDAMAKAGAAGKTGFDAISAIVRSFERPANPEAEIAKALAYYKQIPEQLGGALTEAGAATSASTVQTLKQIAAIVKQGAKTIGLDHARQVIAGMLEGSPGIVAQARQAMQQAVAAAKQAVVDAKGELIGAFRQMATDALAAFDAVTAKWKPPSLALLLGLQEEDAKDARDKAAQGAADAVKAAQDAANAARAAGPQEGETPEQFQARLAELDKAYTEAVLAQGATLRGIFEEELQDRANAEQAAWDTRREKLRNNLTLELQDIQKGLEDQTLAYGTAQKRIVKLLNKYIPDLNTAGYKLAHAFSDGFSEGIDAVIAAAKKLAAALEEIPGVKGAGGGGGGGGATNPGTAIGGGHGAGVTAFRPTGVTVNVYGDVTGQEVVNKVRTALQQTGLNNASNPLAAF